MCKQMNEREKIVGEALGVVIAYSLDKKPIDGEFRKACKKLMSANELPTILFDHPDYFAKFQDQIIKP